MTEREAFEAFCKNTGRHPDDMKLAIWQAACAWRRERDARTCERYASDADNPAVAYNCADKIRSDPGKK